LLAIGIKIKLVCLSFSCVEGSSFLKQVQITLNGVNSHLQHLQRIISILAQEDMISIFKINQDLQNKANSTLLLLVILRIMHSFFGLLFATLIFLQPVSKAAIFISFKLNQEYIAKNLCENKDKPKRP
jgi:hypothetical protein